MLKLFREDPVCLILLLLHLWFLFAIILHPLPPTLLVKTELQPLLPTSSTATSGHYHPNPSLDEFLNESECLSEYNNESIVSL